MRRLERWRRRRRCILRGWEDADLGLGLGLDRKEMVVVKCLPGEGVVGLREKLAMAPSRAEVQQCRLRLGVVVDLLTVVVADLLRVAAAFPLAVVVVSRRKVALILTRFRLVAVVSYQMVVACHPHSAGLAWCRTVVPSLYRPLGLGFVLDFHPVLVRRIVAVLDLGFRIQR